jgi:acetyl esterase
MPTDYEALRERRMAELDDPELEKIYEITGSGLHIRERGVDGLREFIGQGMRTMGSGDRRGVVTRDIKIPGPAGEISARIYSPEGADGPTGAYFHTHGGGFVAGGGFETFDDLNCSTVLDWGCSVVHPDFRLPPENPFPAGVEDNWAALQWVGEHGAEVGIDTDRIAVGGGCTGANMAAVMALMARDAGAPKLAAQFLYAPRFDLRTDYRSEFEFADGYGLARDDDQFVTSQYLSDPEERWDWRASPALVDSLKGVAPAFFAVGEWEILRDDARAYANRMRDAGVEVHYTEGEKQGHGHTYWRNLETGEFTAGAKKSQAEVASFMKRKIGSESASS